MRTGWLILTSYYLQSPERISPTPNLLQLSDDPFLLILPGLHDGRNCVEALMAEKSAGTDALQPKQSQHSDGLSSHAAQKVNGTAE